MKKHKRYLAWCVLIGLALSILTYIFNRPIWFDEAWSIMGYSTLSLSDIYLCYNAPNNHILFNIILKLWLDTAGGLLPVSEFLFRIPTVFISLITVALMFHLLRKRTNFHAAFLTTLCFIVSTLFMIYGTAVRGYMLSILLILCGLESSLRFLERKNKKYLVFYVFSALTAVAVIPSNLFAFAVIAPLSLKNLRDVSLLKKCFAFAILPVVAFLLFYGPVWKNLYIALKNNNGWLHPEAACLHLYSAFILNFLPIVTFALIGGFFLLKRKKIHWGKLLSLLIILFFPAIIILFRTPAPFPRVFLQILPILFFLIAMGIKHLIAILGKERLKAFFYSGIFLILGWGVLLHELNPFFSKYLTKNFSQDDFFMPFYMKENFCPLDMVKKLIHLTGKKKKTVFLSPNSDWVSIVFYGKLQGLEDDFWIQNYYGKKKLEGADNADIYFLVVRNKKDLNIIKEKFGLKNPEPVDLHGVDEIYAVKK